MSAALSRSIYDELRCAILTFVETHPDKAILPFRSNMSRVGIAWQNGVQALLPAAEFMPAALQATIPETHELTALFSEHRKELKWEQSYTRSDNLVGDDMLNGYAFVEVIGKNGPFVSTTVRSGIGVWGPGIDYPVHNHMAEEIYVPLAGSAAFTLDDKPYRTQRAGDAVHVRSNQRHGFRTTSQPFIVFYIWQNGDLRQKSTFG